MIIHTNEDLVLDRIADSGQCFRWEKTDGRTYRVLAGERCMYITEHDSGDLELDCTEEEFRQFWRGYLDLEEDYAAIRARIDPEQDPFLWQASEQEKGIRILRQDPWEMLISFIISQNKNIPAIRRSIDLLAKACGEQKEDSRGVTYYAFPGPEAIAALCENDLKQCSLGYRCKYVHAAAEAVLGSVIDLEALKNAEEESTIKALTGLFGVGVKVASCVSLFGLHHMDAFPQDVWIKRILAQEYAAGYPFAQYSPYNGVYQQYMFAFYRNGKAQ